ncbi:MAG: acyl carrier protein phosphodiesterase, partial [Pseudomonadota bacterium]
CDRFPEPLRRIAPILVDILCDHLLTQHWASYSSETLAAFTRRVYREVRHHGDWLPESGREFLSYAEERDLLAAYGDFRVTERAMGSITRRLKREELNPLIAEAVPPLLEDLSADFNDYFPDILAHAEDWVLNQDVAQHRQS